MPLDFSSLLPPHQPVELPSRGKYYQNIPSLKSGFINIREYSAQEEALLAHMNRENVQLVLNAMLDSCIRLEGFTAEDLTTEDAFYLLVWLRANSYGPSYDIEVTCPHRECGQEDTYIVNLGTLPITYLNETDPMEPVKIITPKTGLTIEVNCMRRVTEVQAQRRGMQLRQVKGMYKGDIADLLKRAYSVGRVTTKEGQQTTDRLEIENLILKYLPAADSLVIDRAIEGFKHGVDVNIQLTCHACNREIFTVVPPGPEFFRPTRIRVETPGEPTRTDPDPVEVREPGQPLPQIVNPLSKNKTPRHVEGDA